MKYLLFSIEIIIISLFTSNCEQFDSRLKIINNSNVDIYCFYSCDSSLNDLVLFKNGYYKDAKGDSTYVMSNQYVRKKTFQHMPQNGSNAWNDFINNCKNKELHIYIFIDSILNKYTDNEIKNKRLYNRHLKVPKSELEKNNWTITYP